MHTRKDDTSLGLMRYRLSRRAMMFHAYTRQRRALFEFYGADVKTHATKIVPRHWRLSINAMYGKMRTEPQHFIYRPDDMDRRTPRFKRRVRHAMLCFQMKKVRACVSFPSSRVGSPVNTSQLLNVMEFCPQCLPK